MLVAAAVQLREPPIADGAVDRGLTPRSNVIPLAHGTQTLLSVNESTAGGFWLLPPGTDAAPPGPLVE